MEPHQAFRSYFEQSELKYTTDEDGDFRLIFGGTPSDFRQLVFFQGQVADTGLTRVQVACIADTRVPLDHYWQALDFLGRVNDNNAFASWCIDPDDGVITCKCVLLTDIGMSVEMARAISVVTRSDMDDVMSQLMAISYGGKTGAQAFAEHSAS